MRSVQQGIISNYSTVRCERGLRVKHTLLQCIDLLKGITLLLRTLLQLGDLHLLAELLQVTLAARLGGSLLAGCLFVQLLLNLVHVLVVLDHFGEIVTGAGERDTLLLEQTAGLNGGSLAPFGGYKGYGIALMVEILAAGLTGAHWSFQSSSFGDDLGGPPSVGQLFLALDPVKFSAGAGFARHLETMLSELESRPGARLPGARRAEAQAQARAKGIVVSADLLLQNIALSH